ncbi:hypothetical protein INR49_000876 [Caranx melampygus]|nr:hypothetical protein INR49_000876 [Caranx melampygus]
MNTRSTSLWCVCTLQFLSVGLLSSNPPPPKHNIRIIAELHIPAEAEKRNTPDSPLHKNRMQLNADDPLKETQVQGKKRNGTQIRAMGYTELRKRPRKTPIRELLLEICWRPVSAVPTPAGCTNLQLTLKLSALLEHQAEEVLDEYIKCHEKRTEPIPDDVPPSIISGDSIPEKLQDTYTRNLLFQLHLERVKEYQVHIFGNPESIVNPLTKLKKGVDNHSHRIKLDLEELYPESTLFASPAPPQFSHNDDHTKKVYGWGVIVSLRNWLKQVQLVVKDTQEANGCDQSEARI